MRITPTLIAGALLTLSSCKEDTVAPSSLFGRAWYNTFEKDQDDFALFTTTNKGEGRQYDGFRMGTDGTFVEYGFGPNDTGEERAGTWTEAGKHTYQIKFMDTQRQGYRLQVQGVDGETLKARRSY